MWSTSTPTRLVPCADSKVHRPVRKRGSDELALRLKLSQAQASWAPGAVESGFVCPSPVSKLAGMGEYRRMTGGPEIPPVGLRGLHE